MDRQPGHQNKAEVIGYRNKYTSFEQHHEKEEDQQSVNEASPESSTAGDEVGIHPKRLCCRVIEDSTETVQDDEDANMADAPAALEKQDHDTARDDENDNGNNSNGNGGHCQNGNAKDIDENDPISSLLRKENEDDPFAWEFESDRIYEGPAVSPPAHVLFAFNHVEEAQRLDIPERPDSKTVWFERMSAAQRQALLSCKLPRDQIAQAFARMKDRIQMEALQDKKLPDTQRWRSGQAAMRFPLSLQSPMAFAPPGSSTYSLQCGIKFAMDPEPWKFGHEMERDEPRHVKKWQEQQQQEQAKRHQKYQQRDLQHRHRHQLPQLDAIIPPHLGPVNPATSVTAPGGLGFPTSNELPWLAFSGTSLAGTRTHPLGIMGCEGRTIPPRPMRSLYRSQSPFVRYAQLGRQQHLHPRISADDYFDRWSRVNIWEAATGSSIPRDATLLASRGERSTPYRMHPFATGAQRASPEEDSRKPSSLMGWNGNLFGYRDDDNPVMQVDNGVDWEVANEAKKRNLSHTKSQNKENASYSEASEKKSGEREGHATAAIDTDETNNGKDNTAVDGPSQPNKNKTSSRILGPGAVNPSSSSSGVNVDANMDVDVDADKLEALKHSKMAPWEAMHSYLTIRRADYATARAFLRACGRLRRRCRAEWGTAPTRSFATAHLIRAMRSHAPALAGALLRAWRAGRVDFEAVVGAVSRWDDEGSGTGMQMVVAGRTLEEWGRADAEKGKGKHRYTKRELTGSRDEGALGLSDEQVRELGFAQEGPDAFSYDV